ncbi:hypothetical protein ACJDU8_25255 [Clostridium sp. WILCCON 0269]|uniref:Uncharacterized protein n=1 Tax=Candidatus Clostridium eludens TaxID=3381663 RepID=A0ABW8SVK1_9CLOT
MGTRCKKCIFKDLDGGKYPCNDCSEIIDIRGVKCNGSYFEPMDEYTKSIGSKERLKRKLNEIVASINKEITYYEYKILQEGNVMLTAFLNNDNEDVTVYQIVDTGENLVQNVVLLERELLYKIKSSLAGT